MAGTCNVNTQSGSLLLWFLEALSDSVSARYLCNPLLCMQAGNILYTKFFVFYPTCDATFQKDMQLEAGPGHKHRTDVAHIEDTQIVQLLQSERPSIRSEYDPGGSVLVGTP